jgi:hypothetical protein
MKLQPGETIIVSGLPIQAPAGRTKQKNSVKQSCGFLKQNDVFT